ncbi:MAG: hypothetical protein U5N27_08600 [Rhizobium sp.]|nr:hypothetical protein [Rhizobium sp.]
MFDSEAKGLMAAAIAEGYTQADLLDVCGGDVSKYIMDKQNAFTDAEVASKD